MPLITTEKYKLYYSHIPKTGGTSIEDYLEKRFGTLSLTHTVGRSRKKSGLILPVHHLAVDDIQELLPHDLDYCFAVVRNPLDRILSQYHFQTGVSLLSRLSFSTWLRVVIKAAKIEPRVYDNHIRPQSDFIPDSAKIFRLEDGLDEMVSWLDEVTKSSDPDKAIGHLLKSKKRNISISRQDIESIESFYSRDYDRFGYSRSGKSEYRPDKWTSLRSTFALFVARLLVSKQHRDWVK